MNNKPLNRDALEATFEKYKNVKNYCNFRFLGGISVMENNPMFLETIKHVNALGEEDESIQTPFFKVMVDIPSPYRLTHTGEKFVSRIPVVAYCEDAEKYAEQFINSSTNNIIGEGSIQNYLRIDSFCFDSEFNELMKGLIKKYGKSEEDYIEALTTLNYSADGNILPTPHTTPINQVVANILDDGDEAVESLREESDECYINEVNRQGLVFMPPSIREMDNENKYFLHIKVRIRRDLTDDKMKEIYHNMPPLHKQKYDYINVIAFGKKALEYFEEVKQGHPIAVTGRLETSHFKKQRLMTFKERFIIANILGISANHEDVDIISNYIQASNLATSFPTFNVWAENLTTK